MAVEAPVSRFRKNNLKIYMAALIIVAVWLGYDGYFNQNFIDEHTEEGVADSTLIFNKALSPAAIAAALGFGIYFLLIKDKKIVAEDNELVIDGKEKVSYGSIQKVDKTFFESKGFFVITYKSESGAETERKISDRRYDNLSAVLDKLVEQIT